MLRLRLHRRDVNGVTPAKEYKRNTDGNVDVRKSRVARMRPCVCGCCHKLRQWFVGGVCGVQGGVVGPASHPSHEMKSVVCWKKMSVAL